MTKIDYEECIKKSEKASWQLDDIFPSDRCLDFSKNFLPETLVPLNSLIMINSEEKRALNHIMSNGYLNFFRFVEEFIAVFVLQQVQNEFFGDPQCQRALCRLSDEEIKHQLLFSRFNALFNKDFNYICDVVTNSAEIITALLRYPVTSTWMFILHLELLTQTHYLSSVQNENELDPFFKSLLKNHWMEERQHTVIDILELEKNIQGETQVQRQTAFNEYSDLLNSLDQFLLNQSKMDVRSLQGKIGRTFSQSDEKIIQDLIWYNYRRLFIDSGLTNTEFIQIVDRLFPDGKNGLNELAAFYLVK